jgi:hypothetical protein
MISELVKWFGRRDDRRAFDRRTERYVAIYRAEGQEVQAIGMDISATGLQFVAKIRPSTQNVNMTLVLKERRVPVRVATRRIQTTVKDGETVFVIAAQFTGVAADDWDAIVRFVNGAPEPQNVAKQELRAKAGSDDDAYRMLPLAVQQELVRQLVRARRLSPPTEGQHPLLRLRYTGNRARNDGSTQHRVVVHSRIRIGDETLAYDTAFLLEENGSVTMEP